MSTLRRPGNVKITAPKQVTLLRDEIKRRQNELRTLEERISVETRQLKLDAIAVQILAVKLDFSKRGLATSKRELADLLHFKKQLDDVGYESSDDVEAIPGQIEMQERKVAALSHKVDESREALNTKQLVHSISSGHIDAMKTHREGILDTVAKLSVALSPIHDISAEVWAVVFRFRLEDDIETYLSANGRSPIYHTPLILSQVCALWRRVVRMERSLWAYFVCHSGDAKDRFEIERWKLHTAFKPSSLAFIVHVANAPNMTFGVNPKAMVPFYFPNKLHLTGEGGLVLAAVHRLPFRGQESLYLRIDQPQHAGLIEAIPPHFVNCTDLQIVSTSHLLRLEVSLYARVKPLTIVRLNLTTFDPFDIKRYGSTRHIKELYLLHNGTCHIPPSAPVPLLYEKLQILGVTPPDTTWMDSFRFPSIEKLILYGPKLQKVAAPPLQPLAQHASFCQVKRLELQNWPRYNPTGASPWTIMPLVFQISARLRSVETIRCVDSFIDGGAFAALVKSLKTDSPASAPSKLKTVIIDCCTGITRHHCELIAASVEKLVMHV